jgi:hypothetical protein
LKVENKINIPCKKGFYGTIGIKWAISDLNKDLFYNGEEYDESTSGNK